MNSIRTRVKSQQAIVNKFRAQLEAIQIKIFFEALDPEAPCMSYSEYVAFYINLSEAILNFVQSDELMPAWKCGIIDIVTSPFSYGCHRNNGKLVFAPRSTTWELETPLGFPIFSYAKFLRYHHGIQMVYNDKSQCIYFMCKDQEWM